MKQIAFGNFFTIRDVLQEYDAEVERAFILARSTAVHSITRRIRSNDARAALARLYHHSNRLTADRGKIDWSGAARDCIQTAMDDDFNTPVAVSILFELAELRQQNR